MSNETRLQESAKGGRPRVDEPKGSSVTTWVPARQHDRLIREANARGLSVSEYVRRTLTRTLGA